MQIQIQWIWGLIRCQQMLLARWPRQSGFEMQNLRAHYSPTELEGTFHHDPQMILMLVHQYTRSSGVSYK